MKRRASHTASLLPLHNLPHPLFLLPSGHSTTSLDEKEGEEECEAQDNSSALHLSYTVLAAFTARSSLG